MVETMNTLIQERNNHSDTCIRIKVKRVTQKTEVYLVVVQTWDLFLEEMCEMI